MEKLFKENLSEQLSSLLGLSLTPEHIYSDNPGFGIYIKKLLSPLILVNSDGYLMVVLPNKDYKRLEDGEIFPKHYIKESQFYYGYFSGEGDFIHGVFWRTLEKGHRGINDTSLINEKLSKLQAEITNNGLWEGASERSDNRIPFVNAIKERILDELGFTVANVIPIDDEEQINQLLLFKGKKSNTVDVYVSREVLNKLLFNHYNHNDYKKAVEMFTITLGCKWQAMREKLPEAIINRREYCLKFWRKYSLDKSDKTNLFRKLFQK